MGKLIFSLLFAAALFSFSNTIAQAATVTWDGGGGDNNWSTCANWNSGTPDTCPTSADDVIFSSTSTKNSTVDAGFGGVVRSVSINTGYSGTIDLARSLQTTNFFSQATGTFTAGAHALDIGASFTLSGGSFTASSGTTTMRLALAISGGTFNHNNGTLAHIHVAGNTYSFSCNNTVFNLVTFDTNGVLTINANCSLPLGNNPTILSAGRIILNGTLSGTGTLTRSSTFQPLELNAGAVLSGFSGLNSALVVQGATADFSSYTTFISPSSGAVSVTSGSLILPNGADLNGALTISGGTFTAPSGTMTLAGSLTISGSPTFNANGGTITFDGSTATLSCNNVSFNLVVFNQVATNIVKTVNSNCSLPLGNNPYIPGRVSLSGTLSGTGTLSTDSRFFFNTGAAFTGFTGLVFDELRLDGGTLDTSNYPLVGMSQLTLNTGTFTAPLAGSTITAIVQSGGTFIGTSGNVTGSSLALSGGSFTAPSGTMSLSASMTISSSSTFNANGGTINFNGGVGTLSCNNATFNLVTFTGQTGNKTVSANCTLPLGANPTIYDDVLLHGTLTGSGTFYVRATTGSLDLMASTATLTGFTGYDSTCGIYVDGGIANFSSYAPFVIGGCGSTLVSGVLTLPNGADLNSNLTISGGTFNAPSGVMTLSGNLIVSGSPTFNANGGTFTLDGCSQSISGSLTFYNLIKRHVDGCTTLTFQAGTTTTILGLLTLQGVEHDLLQLRSSSAGSTWSIDPRGARSVQYVDVQDSVNVSGAVITAICSINSGNNSGWLFLPCGSSVITLVSPSDRSYTRDERPTFSWRPPSDGSLFSAAREYSLIVDTGAGSDFVIEGIPAGKPNGGAVYETDKYRVEYLNWDNEDLGDNLISLLTKSSSTWSSDYHDGKLTEGKRNWRVQLKDSSNSMYEVSNELYVDFTPPTTTISKVNTLDYVPAILTSDTTPTIFGKVVDLLKGLPEDRKVAAGPKNIEIKIEKKVGTGYSEMLTDIITLSKNYWQADDSVIDDNTKNTSDKYSPFEYTFTKALSAGTYKITLTPRDSIDNAFTSQIFQMRVAGYDEVWGGLTSDQQQNYPSTTPEKKEITIPDPNEDQAAIEEKFNQELAQQNSETDQSPSQKGKRHWLYFGLGLSLFALLIWFLLFWYKRKKKKVDAKK